MSDKTLQQCKDQLLRQLSCLYERLGKGLDVSPAMRYRLEGQLELLLQLGQLDAAELQDYCKQQLEANALALPPKGYWQWAQEQGRFFIPAPMVEVPVFKG